jgi:hypothetical protein
MIKSNRKHIKFREDVWVNLEGEYFLGKLIGYDEVTLETIVQVNKKIIRLQPQIIPYK